MSVQVGEFGRVQVALLSAGVSDLPAAFRRVSAAIADRDYVLALRAIEDARLVLDDTARLARMAIPEAAAGGVR